MSVQMTQASLSERNLNNFALLKHRPIFTVALYPSKPQEIDARALIANGRLISAREIEVWILDGSDLADNVRTRGELHFEIELLEGCLFRGYARAIIGESRIGKHERRYVEARLMLLGASVEIVEMAPLKWLT